MKRILIYLTSSLILLSCNGQTKQSPSVDSRNYAAKHHNKLDDINSASEIESIVTSINNDYSYFKVNDPLKFNDKFGASSNISCKHYSDSLKVQPWTKDDFDGNGYTDLLVLGNFLSIASSPPDTIGENHVICIMDSGENNFSIKRITRKSFQDCTFPVVAEIDSLPVILNYHMSEPDWVHHDKVRTLMTDILIFKFGDFVELNSTPATHRIEKIEYSKGRPCFGDCPIFDLTINQNRTASYCPHDITSLIDAKKKMSDKKFTTTIDTTNFHLLINLLNYIDFAKLDSNYAVGCTDSQDCTLKITYDNGKIKKIDDYGLMGTYGLDRTYDLLFNLRENQQWK